MNNESKKAISQSYIKTHLFYKNVLTKQIPF